MLSYRSCLGLSVCMRGLSPALTKAACYRNSSTSGNDDGAYGDRNLKDMIASYQGADHEFGPYREREQAAAQMDYHVGVQTQRDQPLQVHAMDTNYPNVEHQRSESMKMDHHIDNYDKQGTISLHSVMQSMVPDPFQPVSENQNPGPSNMPGGQPHQNISLRYTSEQRHGNNDPAGEIV